MTFTAFTNVITILFCLAVLVQSVRLARSLRQVRESQLDRTVGALDDATARARGVLSEMKATLSTEGAANAVSLREAKEVREELHVMVGIANAMAERLMEAASAASHSDAKAAAKPAQPPKAARPRRAQTKQAKVNSKKAPAAVDELLLDAAVKKPTARKPGNSPSLTKEAA